MRFSTDDIVGFYARPNYGKTWATKQLVAAIAPRTPVFIFDTNRERSAYTDGMPLEARRNIFYIRAEDPSDQTDPDWVANMLVKVRGAVTNAYIVFEDIDKLFNSQAGRENEEIRKFASDSRHQRLGAIYSAKEPTNIPPKLRSATTCFFIGQVVEPAHLKTLGQLIDSEVLRNLKAPEFVMYDRRDNIKKVVVFEEGGAIRTISTL